MDKDHSAHIIAEYTTLSIWCLKLQRRSCPKIEDKYSEFRKNYLSPKANICYTQGLISPMILLFCFISSKYSFSQVLPTLQSTLEIRRRKFLPGFAKTYFILYWEENFPVHFRENTKVDDKAEPHQGIKPSLQLMWNSTFFKEKNIMQIFGYFMLLPKCEDIPYNHVAYIIS